ncbi:MAG: hypothetical protein QXG12_04365 [Thermoproteota archaeon]
MQRKEFQKLRERILAYARDRLGSGEPLVVRKLIADLGIHSEDFYRAFPGGRSQLLEEVKRTSTSTFQAPGRGELYARIFKLLDRGVPLHRILMKLGVEPERLEDAYNIYLRLRGIDVNLLREEISRVKRSNELLNKELELLREEMSRLEAELGSAYGRGYSEGYREGFKAGSRSSSMEWLEFILWRLRKDYPLAGRGDLISILIHERNIYNAERIIKKYEEG